MQPKLEDYLETISTMLANKKKQASILKHLIEINGGITKGFSERSLRRFIQTNNLGNRVNDQELNEHVQSAITQLGPSYGRAMLTGALRSVNVNASVKRVARAAILADPISHNLRVEVSFDSFIIN
jgi:hypothetical protein